MEKIHSLLVIEILGRPKEHVKEALTTLVTRLGSEKGVKIINKQIHEPIPVQDSQTLFTTFAEISAEFETIETYLAIIFAYMPSNIEVIQPERITLTNSNLNEIGNDLVKRLHNYDTITKQAITERGVILSELKKSAPEVYKKLTTPLEPQGQKSAQKKAVKKKKKSG